MRYLRAAVLVRVEMRGVGRVPVNLLLVGCAALLGCVSPLFWWVGLGGEALFLTLLVMQPRFRRLVDATSVRRRSVSAQVLRAKLMGQLAPGAYNRMVQFNQQIVQAEEAIRARHAETLFGESNCQLLGQLAWMYLKLLILEQHLLAANRRASPSELARDIAALEAEIARGGLEQTLRASKAATLALAKKRLAMLGRRRIMLDGIYSDLARIEAQVNLAAEDVAFPDNPQLLSAGIERISQLFEDGEFGALQPTIADIDTVLDSYRPRQRAEGEQE